MLEAKNLSSTPKPNINALRQQFASAKFPLYQQQLESLPSIAAQLHYLVATLQCIRHNIAIHPPLPLEQLPAFICQINRLFIATLKLPNIHQYANQSVLRNTSLEFLIALETLLDQPFLVPHFQKLSQHGSILPFDLDELLKNLHTLLVKNADKYPPLFPQIKPLMSICNLVLDRQLLKIDKLATCIYLLGSWTQPYNLLTGTLHVGKLQSWLTTISPHQLNTKTLCQLISGLGTLTKIKHLKPSVTADIINKLLQALAKQKPAPSEWHLMLIAIAGVHAWTSCDSNSRYINITVLNKLLMHVTVGLGNIKPSTVSPKRAGNICHELANLMAHIADISCNAKIVSAVKFNPLSVDLLLDTFKIFSQHAATALLSPQQTNSLLHLSKSVTRIVLALGKLPQYDCIPPITPAFLTCVKDLLLLLAVNPSVSTQFIGNGLYALSLLEDVDSPKGNQLLTLLMQRLETKFPRSAQDNIAIQQAAQYISLSGKPLPAWMQAVLSRQKPKPTDLQQQLAQELSRLECTQCKTEHLIAAWPVDICFIYQGKRYVLELDGYKFHYVQGQLKIKDSVRDACLQTYHGVARVIRIPLGFQKPDIQRIIASIKWHIADVEQQAALLEAKQLPRISIQSPEKSNEATLIPEDKSVSSTTQSIPEIKDASNSILCDASAHVDASMILQQAAVKPPHSSAAILALLQQNKAQPEANIKPESKLPISDDSGAAIDSMLWDNSMHIEAAMTLRRAAEQPHSSTAILALLQESKARQKIKPAAENKLSQPTRRIADSKQLPAEMEIIELNLEQLKMLFLLANYGDVEALYYLALHYLHSSNPERDPTVGINLLKAAARAGSPEAQAELGYRYLQGEDIDKDPALGAQWSEAAARKGVVHAQLNIGECYSKGIGVERDLEAAQRWMEAAAAKGNIEAQLIAATYYTDRTPPDLPNAIFFYTMAAGQGDKQAQCLLGACYSESNDLHSAVFWFKKSAKQGYAQAQHVLACNYFNGIPDILPLDMRKAFRLFTAAAEQGHQVAQLQLAICYEHGYGTAADISAARKWCLRAAEQGYSQAQYKLGLYCALGKGGKVDDNEAVKWLRAAAAQGHEQAADTLKKFYPKSQLVSSNPSPSPP